MRKIVKGILSISLCASFHAQAADKDGRVWIVKAHPAKMCADPTDDPVTRDAIKLEKIGVPVFESSIEVDQAILAAKLDCGRSGYYVMAHLVPETKAEKAKAMGYLVTPDNYSHRVAKVVE